MEQRSQKMRTEHKQEENASHEDNKKLRKTSKGTNKHNYSGIIINNGGDTEDNLTNKLHILARL